MAPERWTRMARASKRTKTTATSTVTVDDAKSPNVSEPGQPQLATPFQTGPSLERIPDDILREILSYLPTLRDVHVLFGYRLTPPVVPFTSLVRTPTRRALFQTSRLLRSRCLAMAWERVELCGASLPNHSVTFFRAIGEATKVAISVLKACPRLWPLVQSVSVVLTRYQSAEIIPEFAACLIKLPNITTIEAVKIGFEGKKLPSVRRITLLCSAHEIIKSCNLEEVTCMGGDGSTIIGSLVKDKRRQLRVLKDVYAPLARLVKIAPNLRHISMLAKRNMELLAVFPLLDTIEIYERYQPGEHQTVLPSVFAASGAKETSEIVKENMSQAEKVVIVTLWHNIGYHQDLDLDKVYTVREVIKV